MVVCEQLLVGGEIKRYNPPTPCQNLEKPPTVELCNYGNIRNSKKKSGSKRRRFLLGICPTSVAATPKPPFVSGGDIGGGVASSSGESRQEYRFKIGGEAKVYEGSRLKIKCPVKNFDRARISWLKDGVPLKQSGNTPINSRPVAISRRRLISFSRKCQSI